MDDGYGDQGGYGGSSNAGSGYGNNRPSPAPSRPAQPAPAAFAPDLDDDIPF
jgi:hypothetical protein